MFYAGAGLKFKTIATTLKNGTTVYGLVGTKSDNFDALKIKLK